MNDRSRLPVVSAVGLTIEQPNGDVLLRDAALELYPGEVVLLVGAVGSGKSTLLRLLSGLIVNGRSGWTISGRVATASGGTIDLAREACPAGAMVFQDHALFDDLTARENIDIAASHARSRSAVAETLVGALTRGVPTDGVVSARSGGQRQLIAIARTVVADPQLLLFDEPNSGLDAGKVVRLAGILEVIKREARRPLLEQAVAENQRALELAETRYRVGSDDLRAVEQQMLRLYGARSSLVRVESEQLVQRVNLHLALGGDFGPAGS